MATSRLTSTLAAVAAEAAAVVTVEAGAALAVAVVAGASAVAGAETVAEVTCFPACIAPADSPHVHVTTPAVGKGATLLLPTLSIAENMKYSLFRRLHG